jgi:hypothetical protein
MADPFRCLHCKWDRYECRSDGVEPAASAVSHMLGSILSSETDQCGLKAD